MEERLLTEKLCSGVAPSDSNELNKVRKVLAPFLRNLKKGKVLKADILPTVYEQLYLKENPKELLKRLEDGFSDPLETKTLLNETAELLRVITKSKAVNLYLTDYEHNQIVLCPKFYKNPRFEKRYVIEPGTYLAPYVASTKEYVISSDIIGDVRFPDGIPEVSVVKSALCLPILTNVKENCIGILELYKECSDKPYDLANLQICNALTAWVGIAIEQNTTRLRLLKEMEIQKQISHLTDLYFSKIIPFDKTIADLLEIVKKAVSAEKAAFYVFSEPLTFGSGTSMTCDAYEEGKDDTSETVLHKKRMKVRFTNRNFAIVAHAARTGEIVNIHDAYKDIRFDKKSDSPFYRTRSLAAFPIKNEKGALGVLKIVNNLEYPFFRQEDVALVDSLLRGVKLICEFHNQEVLFTDTQMTLEITDRLLILQSKPTSEDYSVFKNFSQAEAQLPPGFFKFDWDGMYNDEDCHKYVLILLLCSDLMEPIFDLQILMDFVLRIRKSYRAVLYHNFDHAICVLHCAFNILLRNKEFFKPTEIVSILLAALCHDVDHTGITNTFLALQNDVIFKLYGEYCGEIHRYHLVIFIIQQTDLLINLSNEDYEFISGHLRKLIMSFDLSVHLEQRKKIITLLNKDDFSWENPEHRFLTHYMILYCSEHSHNFKSFKTVKKVTLSFYKELFKQGDLEKSMGFTVLPIMDRNKIDSYPENQSTFLVVVVVPLVEILVRLFPSLNILDDLLKETLKNWYEIQQYKDMNLWRLTDALLKKKDRKDSYRLAASSTLSSFGSLSEAKL